jgi:hypothetical protein
MRCDLTQVRVSTKAERVRDVLEQQQDMERAELQCLPPCGVSDTRDWKGRKCLNRCGAAVVLVASWCWGGAAHAKLQEQANSGLETW